MSSTSRRSEAAPVARMLRRTAVALALLLAVGGGHAAARDLVVGVENIDYWPAYAMRDGQYAGAGREILDAFAADLGDRFVYRPLPVRRLYADLLSGAIDFKFPDNPGWGPDVKHGHEVAYSGPVIRYVDGVMVLPERRGLGVPALKTLGTVTGFTPFAWLDLIRDRKVKLVENPQLPLLLRQALTGRIDGAYVSIAVATYQLDVLRSPSGLVFDPALPHSRESYRLSATRHPDVIEAFDRWLADKHDAVEAIRARNGAERGID